MADKQQSKSLFAQVEEELIKLWEKEKTFAQSLKQREGKPRFIFYDGPPFANGLPHFGHSLVSAIKDAIPRYKTMRGFYVPRRNGWDCHGLPVEYEVEKSFSVSGKKQILELGLEKFNAACRASIFRYKDEWEHLLQRIGRWSDYENYYATVDTSYTESVWWVLKQIHAKGLLYRGLRSLPYCPRCTTPLSNFELNEGYKDSVEDPSLFVTFPLKGQTRKLLAWTTTPWSLGGNTAVAISPKERYVTVELKNDLGQTEQLVLAKKRLEVLNQPYEIVQEESGQDLVGLEYEPIYQLDDKTYPQVKDPNIYKVWPADFVSIEDGTGLVHVAPATGVDDLDLGQVNNFPLVRAVDENGRMLGGIGFEDIKGMFFKDADRLIIEHLTKAGRVFAAEMLSHTYPFCWRCDTPLMYYAIDAWMVAVSKIRPDLLKTAASIHWVPSNIKKGRFGKWLEGARDWTISRNRYWGAPMPIWQNIDNADDFIVVESIAELKKLAGNDIKVEDLHRPFIDKITFTKDGKTYKRIEEVLDCWFESGSMSVAQYHYPFEQREQFKETFPADFIIEGLDQTRLWFYVQHVVATILFNQPAFKNVVVNGMIMAADGQKLSKRLKNYPPIEEVFAKEGADSLRLYLLSSTQATEVADYMRFDRDGLTATQRNVVMTFWNTFNFFRTYAATEASSLKPAASKENSNLPAGRQDSQLPTPNSPNILDQWILNRLNQTVAETTKAADKYHIAKAVRQVIEFIDDLSNWYLRRSRRRFWKNEDEQDKQNAFATLHYVLIQTCQILAPWAPFISDKIYRELRSDDMPRSVHLTDWPQPAKSDTDLLLRMETVKALIAEGLKQRAAAGIKVRQPLNSIDISGYPAMKDLALRAIVHGELNVKLVELGSGGEKKIKLDTELTPELKREGSACDIVRQVQQLRKESGLTVQDSIVLGLKTNNKELTEAINEHAEMIKDETLAESLDDRVEGGKEVKIGDAKLELSITKTKG